MSGHREPPARTHTHVHRPEKQGGSAAAFNGMAPIALEYTKDGSLGVSKTIKKEGSGKKPSMGDHLRVTYSGFLDDAV